MGISQLKKQALFSLKGKWGVAVGLTVIVFLVSFVPQILVDIIASGGFTEWMYQDETTIIGDIFGMLFSIATLPLFVAMYWFYLGIAREEDPTISEVFSIYKNSQIALKMIFGSILQGVFIFLWSLLLLIPGIIKAFSYSQMFYLLRDHPELTPLEAISESKKRMKGLKGKYFLMYLSFIGWAILVPFTLGIGLLWLAPYMETTRATFYNELIVNKENSIIEY